MPAVTPLQQLLEEAGHAAIEALLAAAHLLLLLPAHPRARVRVRERADPMETLTMRSGSLPTRTRRAAATVRQMRAARTAKAVAVGAAEDAAAARLAVAQVALRLPRRVSAAPAADLAAVLPALPGLIGTQLLLSRLGMRLRHFQPAAPLLRRCSLLPLRPRRRPKQAPLSPRASRRRGQQRKKRASLPCWQQRPGQPMQRQRVRLRG